MMNKRLGVLLLIVCLLLTFCGAAAAENFNRVSGAGSASVQVCVFSDANRNGDRGGNEGGLAGAVVELVSAGEAVARVTTGEDGMAEFAQLPEGSYSVRVTLPAGKGFGKAGAKPGKLTSSCMQQSAETVQETAVLEVAEGAAVRLGVGAVNMSGVRGRVWLDDNDDGLMQAEEPGYSGLAITLTNEKKGVRVTVYSGENGLYEIPQLMPGSYELSAVLPDGYSFAKYVKVGGNKRSIFSSSGSAARKKTVNAGKDGYAENENIGLITSAKVRGVVYLDANYNGLYDEGETLVSGVKLEVIKQNKGDVVGRATTAKDGAFEVDNLRSSTYQIRVVLPEGLFFTRLSAEEGGNRFKANAGRREYTISDVKMEVGGVLLLNVGAIKPAKVTGTVYQDDDFSGTRSGKEKTVSGITVNLLDAQGNVVAADKTSAKGVYEFGGLVPGTYTVAMTAKEGYAFTKTGAGNVMRNTGKGTGRSDAFEVPLGETISGMDCGMILPGVVQGKVFGDANDNGVQDMGETGLVGTVVRLMSDEGEHFAAEIGEDGLFCFDAVMPGRYYLQYDLPEDTVRAKVAANGNTLGEGDADVWFDFPMASHVDAPLCGGVVLSSIGGKMFHDANANGVQDAGEDAVSGAAVTLVPAGGEPVVAMTDEAGAYLLSGLRPDEYTMSVEFPEGHVLSNAAALSLPVTAGYRGGVTALTIPMGTKLRAQDLGTVKAASIAGCLWLDASNDGVLNEDEFGTAGEQIVVIDEANGEVFATLVTAADGSFRTDDIAMVPGTYKLVYTLDDNSIAAPAGDSTFKAEDGVLVMGGIALAEGEERNDVRVGVVRYTRVGGHVWVDRGGEVEVLPGAQIALLDADGKQVAAAESDEAGAYCFEKLLPGQYQLAAELPAGQIVVEPGDDRLVIGGQKSVMATCTGRSAVSDVFTLRMAKDAMDMDVGGVLPARVGDLVWLDVNGNGLQDSGELGIPNVTLKLMRGGVCVAETTTDQYGFYYFGDVYPASYTIAAQAPASVRPTTLRTDIIGVNSIVQDSGETLVFTVTSGKRFYNADLGFVPVNPGEYPAGYGQGATQDWTKLGTAN